MKKALFKTFNGLLGGLITLLGFGACHSPKPIIDDAWSDEAVDTIRITDTIIVPVKDEKIVTPKPDPREMRCIYGPPEMMFQNSKKK